MADLFEKANEIVSDGAKAKGNCNLVKYLFFLEKHN